jgi:hypothetical protein
VRSDSHLDSALVDRAISRHSAPRGAAAHSLGTICEALIENAMLVLTQMQTSPQTVDESSQLVRSGHPVWLQSLAERYSYLAVCA